MKNWRKKFILLIVVVISFFALKGCKQANKPFEASNPSDLSVSGYSIGISAIHGGSSLRADGSSQATIRVEVWESTGQFINNVPVTLTATLGTLASSSSTTTPTTTDGVYVDIFTAGNTAGVASVTATVENISVSATIVLSRF